jgi:hypothetical protein
MLTYKIIDARQAKSINVYMNTKRKLLKCNANIKFNQICLAKNLTPQYAKRKIPGHQAPARHTEKQAKKIRIKYEIKFLHKKKQQLKLQLYRIHRDNSNKWSRTWDIIEHNIHSKLKIGMREIYLHQDNKIKQ